MYAFLSGVQNRVAPPSRGSSPSGTERGVSLTFDTSLVPGGGAVDGGNGALEGVVLFDTVVLDESGSSPAVESFRYRWSVTNDF